jgi:hypothetical protein
VFIRKDGDHISYYSVRVIPWGTSGQFPSRRFGYNIMLVHVGFVEDKVTLGQVFSKYFSFPC